MSFEKVDHLFAESVLAPYSTTEEDHLLLAELMQKSREGHLCMPLLKPHTLPEALFESLLHQEKNRLYLKRNWECESQFIEALENFLQQKIVPLDVDHELFESDLAEEQRLAVKRALHQNLTLICGGPGTGKSHTASVLITLFSKKGGGKVAACAPTGKAASHLAKKLPQKIETATLHALVGKGYLPYDLLVVDEGSMIDAPLMAKLFSMLKVGSRLVILGDDSQLPPVETGNLFADLVAAKKECVAPLSTCYRTELKEVVDLALCIKKGKIPSFSPFPSEKELLEELTTRLRLNVATTLEESFMALTEFRPLSPLRKGPFGVDALNQKLYEIHSSFRHPNCFVPLLICENETRLGLANGEMGLLSTAEKRVYFEGKDSLPLSHLPRYEWGYVLSVHKSQGSEYDEVMVLLPPFSEAFGKTMLYTAVTRGKRKVEIFGAPETLEKIMKNSYVRESGLYEKFLAQPKEP